MQTCATDARVDYGFPTAKQVLVLQLNLSNLKPLNCNYTPEN